MSMQDIMNDMADLSKEVIALKDERHDLQAKYAAVVAELEQAQNEIERLKHDSHVYNKLLENNLICNACGGIGVVGSPPDDYYDCPECVKLNNEIKAEAILAANDYAHKIAGDQGYCTIDGQDIINYADKVKRGES